MEHPNLITRFAQRLDIFWMQLNGLAIDLEFVLSGEKPRAPLTFHGTLKIEPSLIPGADSKLHKALEKYGGWPEVMQSPRPVPEELFIVLERLGYTRDCIEKSREYIRDPAAYTAKAMRDAEVKHKNA